MAQAQMRRVRTLPFFFFIFYMVFIITIIASQIIIMEAFDKTCFSNLCLGIFAIPRQNYQKYLSRFEVVIYWKWGPFQKCWHFHPFIVLSAKLIGSFLYCAFHRHCQVGQVEGILRGEARQQKLSFSASKQNVLCIKTQMGSGGGDGRHGWGILDTVGERGCLTLLGSEWKYLIMQYIDRSHKTHVMPNVCHVKGK